MLTRRTVVEVATETTAGTDPASGFTPMLAWDVDLDVKGEVLTRDILRDTLSPIAHVVGMKEISCAFKTEIKSGGVASGTAGQNNPEMHDLLIGCGFGTASYTGTAPIVYSVKSAESDLKTISLYIHVDGNKHKITGARGTGRFIMEAGKYGICEWEFQGLYNAVIEATIPDISAASNINPPIIYNSNFQIGGFSPVCSRCQIDLANNVVRRDDLNATFGVDSFRISGRKPVMEFDADAVVESSNPFWGDWSGDVIATFAIVAGSGTHGKEIMFDGYFQYETNKYGDADGIRTFECSAALISSDTNSQDDEITITFT